MLLYDTGFNLQFSLCILKDANATNRIYWNIKILVHDICAKSYYNCYRSRNNGVFTIVPKGIAREAW